MPALSIKIDGTDASQYLQYYTLHVTWQLATTPVVQLMLIDPSGALNPPVGKKLEILIGTTLIWAGTFDDNVAHMMDRQGPAADAITIQCTATGWEKRFDTLRLQWDTATFQNRAFTADSASSTLTTLTTLGNSLVDGCAVQVKNTGGALPGGLAPSTTYYVVNAVTSGSGPIDSQLKLAATPGGSPIALSSNGTGINEIVWCSGGIITAIWARRGYDSTEGITLAEIQPGNPVTAFPIDCATLTDIMNALLAVNPDFTWYIDPSKGLHFVSKSANPAPVNFISTGGGSDTNNMRAISSETLRQDYCNYRLFKYFPGRSGDRVSATLATNGVARQWQVPTGIDSVHSLVLTPSGGPPTNPTVGTLGDTGSDFYIQPGTDTLYQDPGGTVLGSSDTLFIDYVVYGFAITSPASHTSAEITARAAIEGNSGQYMGLSQDTSIADPTVAQQAADNLVTVYGQIPQLVVINTNADGVLPGMTTTVNFPKLGVNGDFLVTQVDLTEVDGQDGSTFEYSIQASSQAVRTWFQFLQILASGGGGASASAAGGAGGGGGGAGANLVLSLTLSAATTNIASPSTPADGQGLLVILTQDSTGGRLITWDAAFKLGPTEISTVHDTATVIWFTGSGGFWWRAADPLTGVVP